MIEPSESLPEASNSKYVKTMFIVLAAREPGIVESHRAEDKKRGFFLNRRTWKISQLESIKSYAIGTFAFDSEESQRYFERNGDCNLAVSLGHFYYWQASSRVERNHFISNLIFHYQKSNDGRKLELVGFDPEELKRFRSLKVQRSKNGRQSEYIRRVHSPRPPEKEPTKEQPDESRQIDKTMNPGRKLSSLRPKSQKLPEFWVP